MPCSAASATITRWLATWRATSERLDCATSRRAPASPPQQPGRTPILAGIPDRPAADVCARRGTGPVSWLCTRRGSPAPERKRRLPRELHDLYGSRHQVQCGRRHKSTRTARSAIDVASGHADGAGGVGKTRLALIAARTLKEECRKPTAQQEGAHSSAWIRHRP